MPTYPPSGRWKILPATKSLTGRTLLARRVQVEVENFFPHRREEDHVALLAGVFLRDLQLDGFVGFFEAAEKWRDGLARLEIDRAVLDLDDDVVVELAVERMKIVVAARARSFLGSRQSR